MSGSVMLVPPQRNYLMWLIIGICTFGLGYLFYLYSNFGDMKKLSMGLSQKNNTPPTGSDPFIGIIAYLVCSPIGVFMKYGQMNDLIDMSGAAPHEPRPPTPILALIIAICTLGIGALYTEWKWQSSMNYHAMKSMQA